MAKSKAPAKASPDDDRFLSDRREYLGMSDIAALFNRSDFGKTPLDVYREKVGLAMFSESNDSKRGKKLETIAADEFTERTGMAVAVEAQPLVHPRLPFLRGHIDRRVLATGRALELKCPRSGKFYRIQNEGLTSGFIFQGQGYLLLEGAPMMHWGIFCADTWEMLPFELEASPTIMTRIEETAERFWNENVLKRVPPKGVNDSDKEALIIDRVGGELNLRTDEPFIDAGRLLREAAAIIDDGKLLWDLAKARVLTAIASKFGKYQGGPLRLNYFESKGRTTLDKDRLLAARPIDLVKLVPWLEQKMTEPPDVTELVTECSLDLLEFFKTGEPFPVFKPSYIDEGE